MEHVSLNERTAFIRDDFLAKEKEDAYVQPKPSKRSVYQLYIEIKEPLEKYGEIFAENDF